MATGLRLSKAKAYKNRVWDKASSKASQYYKGRKNKLDLSYIKSVELSWNPLMPRGANIRRFRRHLVMDETTMNSLEFSHCKINEDMHERLELPYILFNLKTSKNTKVVFDITRLNWAQLTQRLMIWADISKRENNTSIWNPEKFGFEKELKEFPLVNLRHPHELWTTFFPENDQPLKYKEFCDQSNINNILYKNTYKDYVIQTDFNFKNNKKPNWKSDMKHLHTTNEFIPEIDYSCVVWDDDGLIYPNLLQLPEMYQIDLMECQGYVLARYIKPFIKNKDEKK